MLASSHPRPDDLQSGGSGESERLGALYARVTRTLTVVGVVIALALAASLAWLSAFGPGLSAASGALGILLAGHVVNCATGPSGLMPTMTGRTRATGERVGARAIAVGLGWVLVLHWGAAGAAAGVVTSALVTAVQGGAGQARARRPKE